MAIKKAILGLLDYFFFTMMLLISAAIGIYFRFVGGKQNTSEEFLLAGKNMSILPVAFSLMATAFSAITVLGMPAEMYNFGIPMSLTIAGYVVGVVIGSYLFLPVFFDMQATTCYEYLENRFGKKTRTLCSITFVVQMMLYMSVVLYGPALALNAVTNLSIWVSVIPIGAVCTFYCALGGMKAVLWTDVFQATLMYLCVFTILIKGCVDIGGMRNVFRIASEGGRLRLPGFEIDPTVRYTIWNVLLHSLITFTETIGSNQIQVQRLLTVKNVERSRMALFLSILMSVAFRLSACLVGIVIYSNLAGCDPLTSKEKPISSADQLLPYYVMQSLGDIPGLPGLCICGIFSSSLSTVSSAVNSLAAVTMEDFVKPLCANREIGQWKIAMLTKAISWSIYWQCVSVIYGLLCISLTFVIAKFGDVVQACNIVYGMFSGPVFGVFFLGMMTRRSNEKGVITGLVISVTLTVWISFGASSTGLRPKVLPVSTADCPQVDFNQSSISEIASANDTLAFDGDFSTETYSLHLQERRNFSELSYFNYSTVTDGENERYISPLYKISYMWFACIGFFTSVTVGYAVSVLCDLLEGKTTTTKLEYISPVLRRFLNSRESKKDESNSTSFLVLIFSSVFGLFSMAITATVTSAESRDMKIFSEPSREKAMRKNTKEQENKETG